jgi:hypothetical protein
VFHPLTFAVAYAEATAVLIDKLDPGQLKRPSKGRKDRRTCFCRLPLEYPNSSHSHPGGIRKFLLSPIKETSRRSALGSRNHGSCTTKVSESGQFDCFSIDFHIDCFYIVLVFINRMGMPI